MKSWVEFEVLVKNTCTICYFHLVWKSTLDVEKFNGELTCIDNKRYRRALDVSELSSLRHESIRSYFRFLGGLEYVSQSNRDERVEVESDHVRAICKVEKQNVHYRCDVA